MARRVKNKNDKKSVISSFWKRYRGLGFSFIVVFFIVITAGIFSAYLNSSETPRNYLVPYWIANITIIEGIGLSYLAGIILFVIINHIPELYREKKSDELIRPIVKNMHIHLARLYGILEVTCKIQGKNSYSDILFDDELRYYKEYCNGTVSIKSYYRVGYDASIEAKWIMTLCDDLYRVPGFLYISSEISDVIGELYGCGTIRYSLNNMNGTRSYHTVNDLDSVIVLIEEVKSVLEEYYGLPQYEYEPLDRVEINEYQNHIKKNSINGQLSNSYGAIIHCGYRL